MQRLVELHEELIQLSHSKREEIKRGDLDQLSKVLIQERKQVQLISQKETERHEIVKGLFDEQQVTDQEYTMTNVLALVEDGNEREQLEKIMSKLINVIVELRDIEKLYNDLMIQSMQFVQLSLDLLQPSLSRMNYDNKKNSQASSDQSVFDSRA